MIRNAFGALATYLSLLPERIGEGWNRFWFTPSDPLPASILRILVGLAGLYCLGSYTWDLERWLGPQGLMSAGAVVEAIQENTGVEQVYHFSPFNYLKDMPLVWALHGLSLCVVLAFTVGLATPFSAAGSFVVLLMYFHRNPLVTSEFEAVLAFMTLYLAITPAGAYFSIDRWLQTKAAREPETVAPSWRTTVGLRLLQVHITGLYLMMVLSQLSAGLEYHTWWQGEAVWCLAARGETPLVDFTWLRNSLYLVNAWTHAIVLFELLFAVLVWNETLRPLLILLSFVHWILLALLTGLVPFALLMIVAGLGFVTAAEWRGLLGSEWETPETAASAA